MDRWPIHELYMLAEAIVALGLDRREVREALIRVEAGELSLREATAVLWRRGKGARDTVP